jgi:hypothetical protein
MATGRRGSRRDQRQATARPAVEDETQLLGPGLTGSYLVLLAEGGEEMRAGAAALRNVAGLQVAHSRDFKKKPLMSAFDEADTVVFDELGVAVCDTPPDQIQALRGREHEWHPRGRARAGRLRRERRTSRPDHPARHPGAGPWRVRGMDG